MSNKTMVILALIVIVFIASVLMASREQVYEPKFKAGDCAKYLTEGNEFEEPEFLGGVVEILQLGKTHYKTREHGFIIRGKLFKLFDDRYVKVNCETGEKL